MGKCRKITNPAKGILSSVKADKSLTDEQSLQGYLENKHKREICAFKRPDQPGRTESDLEDFER